MLSFLGHVWKRALPSLKSNSDSEMRVASSRKTQSLAGMVCVVAGQSVFD